MARARDSKSLRRGFDSHLGFHERRIMRTLIVALLLFMFVGTAIAKDVYISKPDRNYSVSKDVWRPDPGENVFFYIGAAIKLYEGEKLWRIIVFNGLTHQGGVPTFNFDLCYFQKDAPKCVDVFWMDPTGLNNIVINIGMFKFKIIKRQRHGLLLEFISYLDEENVEEAPKEKTAPKDGMISPSKEDKGNNL